MIKENILQDLPRITGGCQESSSSKIIDSALGIGEMDWAISGGNLSPKNPKNARFI